MASSGSKYINVADTTSGSYTQGVRLLVEWSERSQSIANNTTTIRITLKIVTGTYGQMIGTAPQTWKISCAGKAESDTFTIQQGNNQTRQLGYLDATVKHSADGKGSFTANVQASFNMNFNGWVGTIKGSISGTLDTIPRASKPSVSGSLEMGSAITIKTNRASSGFTHTLKYTFEGHTGTIAEDVGASYAWTPAIATFAPWLADATQADCTITCDTYNGSTKIGSATTKFKLKIPSSVVPAISGVVFTDEKGYYTPFGCYLSTSTLKAVITAAGAQGSTISKYFLKVDNGAAIESASNTITKTNAFFGLQQIDAEDDNLHTITVTVSDSRGRQASKQYTVTAEQVASPKIEATFRRFDTSTGKEDDESTTVRADITITAKDYNGRKLNVPSGTIYYKQVGATDWTKSTTLSAMTPETSWHINITGIDSAKAYDFKVEYTDSIIGYSLQYIAQVPSAQPVIDLLAGGNGIGLLTVADAEGYVKIGGNIRINATNGTMQYLDSTGGWNTFIMFRPGDGVPELFNGGIVPLNASLEFGSAAIKAESGGSLGFYWGLDAPSSKGMMRKTIWEGSWSSGDITVAAHMSYNFFIIHFQGQSAVCFAVRQNPGGAGSRITSIGMSSSATAHSTITCRITSKDEFTWTLLANSAYYYNHTPSGSHGGKTNLVISKIEGLF